VPHVLFCSGEKDLIKMLLIPRLMVSALQLIRILLPKLPEPRAHGFVRQQDPAFGRELFDIRLAQAKAEI
jgi:hypothetical protein